MRAAAAVVTPSAWARSWLLATYGLDPDLVHVARPGVDPVPRVDGTGGGGALLCVGASRQARARPAGRGAVAQSPTSRGGARASAP